MTIEKTDKYGIVIDKRILSINTEDCVEYRCYIDYNGLHKSLFNKYCSNTENKHIVGLINSTVLNNNVIANTTIIAVAEIKDCDDKVNNIIISGIKKKAHSIFVANAIHKAVLDYVTGKYSNTLFSLQVYAVPKEITGVDDVYTNSYVLSTGGVHNDSTYEVNEAVLDDIVGYLHINLDTILTSLTSCTACPVGCVE